MTDENETTEDMSIPATKEIRYVAQAWGLWPWTSLNPPSDAHSGWFEARQVSVDETWGDSGFSSHRMRLIVPLHRPAGFDLGVRIICHRKGWGVSEVHEWLAEGSLAERMCTVAFEPPEGVSWKLRQALELRACLLQDAP